MQAINPINTHTKFGKDRINTFPLNERKPSVRTPDKVKIICPPPSGVDIKIVYNACSVTTKIEVRLNRVFPVHFFKKYACLVVHVCSGQHISISEGKVRVFYAIKTYLEKIL